MLGPAEETLKGLSSDELFDLAFIDADKANIDVYFKEAKRLVRKGGVIVRFFNFFNFHFGEVNCDIRLLIM